jgi:chromosome condensin MukBEF MukE localization factor
VGTAGMVACAGADSNKVVITILVIRLVAEVA